MRMLMNVQFPPKPFNAAVREGTISQLMGQILEDLQPEAVYFTENQGKRGAVLIVDLESPSQVPAFAEPWFLHFEAECSFRVAMTPAELEQGGLAELGRKWS